MALLTAFDDDVFELLNRLEPAEGGDRVFERLVLGRRLAADLSRGDLDVLFAQSVGEVNGREAAGAQPVGVDPHPHAEVLGAEDLDLGNAVDSRQHVLDAGGRVVGNIKVVKRAVGRQHVDHERDVG